MSYSFSVTAATKAEASQMVSAELAKVVESQPVHAADRPQAQAAVEAFLGVVADPAEIEIVAVSVNGSLSWTGGVDSVTSSIVSANVNVTVSLIQK